MKDEHQSIPIFLSADKHYARYASVALVSILEQTTHTIDFHIIDCGIPLIDKKNLLYHISLYPHAQCTFHTINVHELAHLPTNFLPLSTYARLYIPELVPDIDKALYVDIDICMHGDIADIFAFDLEDYGIGATSEDIDNPLVLESTTQHVIERKAHLGLQHDDYYFNAGVLLINCAYWRTHKIKEQCLDTALQYDPELLYYQDQDLLNIVFKSNYKIFPMEFQVFPRFASECEDYQEYINLRLQDPSAMIQHYTTKLKPWHIGPLPIYASWWEYAKLTSLYTEFLTAVCFRSLQQQMQTINNLNGIITYLLESR